MRLSPLLALAALSAPVLVALPAVEASGPVAVADVVSDGDRTEVPVASSSPVTGVAQSVVSLRVPLPESAGPRPESCDRLSYMRWRNADGPAGSGEADRVLLAQPGIFEGAGAFDGLARNTVAAAARLGKNIEFWALDRRSNCLEDHTGVQAALRTGDPHTATDYYYENAAVDGRTFGGFATRPDTAFLAHVGMAQTVRDQYDLITRELPDPGFRGSRLFCGGHSLGGIITGYFAQWDFSGQRGSDQCAGWFALDSVVSTELPLPGMSDTLEAAGITATDATADRLGQGRLNPVLQLPALINPETMNLLALVGLYARLDPAGTSDLLQELPSNTNINATLRMLFSRNYAHFVAGEPGIREFRFTNRAALGAILDDNSMPLGFLQTSVGFATGGPIADKNFPLPNRLLTLPGLSIPLGALVGTDPKAIPTDTSARYDWLNYDQIGTPADPGYRTAEGAPFTGRDKEVTDIHELARSLSEFPLDFTEWYFPVKLAVDTALPDDEIRHHAIHPDGIQRRPAIMLSGSSGVGVHLETPPPNTTSVIAPHYHHLDVITAAPVQNNGRPEVVSTNLLDFVLTH